MNSHSWLDALQGELLKLGEFGSTSAASAASHAAVRRLPAGSTTRDRPYDGTLPTRQGGASATHVAKYDGIGAALVSEDSVAAEAAALLEPNAVSAEPLEAHLEELEEFEHLTGAPSKHLDGAPKDELGAAHAQLQEELDELERFDMSSIASGDALADDVLPDELKSERDEQPGDELCEVRIAATA